MSDDKWFNKLGNKPKPIVNYRCIICDTKLVDDTTSNDDVIWLHCSGCNYSQTMNRWVDKGMAWLDDKDDD